MYIVGTLRSILTCSNCSKASCKTEQFADLSLSIQQRHQSRNTGDVVLTDSSNSLLKCLQEFSAAELLADPIQCEACSQISVSSKQLIIETPPLGLIIQLKRFNATLQKKVINIKCH